MKQAISRVSRIVWWVVLLIGLALAGVVIMNRRLIVDWWRGMHYEPSAEMAEIRDDLGLTDKGKFLFSALQPTLNEADEFNANCHQNASETAVLGCYTDGMVRVYNITMPELSGIREVTTAHEMLHAVWARMNAREQEEFAQILEGVLEENQATLGSELESYDDDAKMEEVYVRAGTEVAQLPEELEKHYGEYFGAREKIVGFYNSYIAVFNEKKEQAEQLQAKMPKLKDEINAAIDAYETEANDLQAAVQEFNACASQANCFGSQAEFSARRGELVGRQQALKAQNEELNGMIAEYNGMVDEYNQVVDDSKKLEKEINSNGLKEVDF